MPKNKDYDKKMFRLMTIVQKLESGGMESTRDLCDEFNVTPRTVQRDLELLNQAGFLVTSPEKGIHTFEKGFSLKKMELSGEEASLLAFFYEIAKSLGGRFEDSFRKIMKKIMQKEYDSPYYAKLPDGPKLNKEYPFISDLEAAVADNEKIEIAYGLQGGATKEHKVHPLKIMYFEGFWYLLAQIGGHDWIVKYRLDRIKDITPCGEYFKAPKKLQEMLDESVSVWFDERPLRKVILKADKEVAQFFKDRKFFPRQKIKTNKDGSLVIEARISSNMEIIPNLMRWIPMVTVVSPKDLKDEVKKKISSYLKKI